MRRSHVQARLTTEEKAIRVLEAKVAELEKWRPDLEQRIKDRSEHVDKEFQEHHNRLEAFKGEVKEQFQVCAMNHTTNDDRYDELKFILG